MKLLKRVGLLKPFNPFFKPGYYLNQSNQYQEMRCDLNTMTQWLNTTKYNSAFHFFAFNKGVRPRIGCKNFNRSQIMGAESE